MFTEEQQQLFAAAKQAQVPRNEMVRIIMSDGDYTCFYGAFVRVLLELQNSCEDYIIARIGGITTGEMYGGFATSSSARTDKYLLLVLPPHLVGINGIQYQLNSISNSSMTETEFGRWLESMEQCHNMSPPALCCRSRAPSIDYTIPTQSELLAIAENFLAVAATVGGGNNNNNRHRSRQQNQQNQQQQQRRSSVLHGGRNPVAMSTAQSYMHEVPHLSRQGRSSHNNNNNNNNGGSQGIGMLPSAYGDGFPIGYTNGSGTSFSAAPARLSRQSTVTALNSTTNNTNSSPSSNNNNANNNNANSTTPRPGSASSTTIVASDPAVPASAVEKEFDCLTRRQVRQDVINKMNQRCVMFPRDVNGLKLSQLRLTERDMIEYLEHVREAISSKQENCVVCMDHVPTVISLPCRHRVLCRLCASSVNTCPVCRSQLFELFEPKEI